MHPAIETIFDEAENRYLKPEELGVLNTYVESLPERMETYRLIRDQEIEVMQHVADQLESRFTDKSQAVLERCLRNALLVMRYASMSMLLNDESFLTNRLVKWLEETASVYETRDIDTALYQSLNQRLSEILTQDQVSLIRPHLTSAEKAVVSPLKSEAKV